MSVPLRLVYMPRLLSLLVALFLLPLPGYGVLPTTRASGMPTVAQEAVAQPSTHSTTSSFSPAATPQLHGTPPIGFVPASLRAAQSPSPARIALPIARPLLHPATTSTVGKIIVSGDEWPLTKPRL